MFEFTTAALGLPARLFTRQKLYKGIEFEQPYDQDRERVETTHPSEAQVISSEWRDEPDTHMVAVDIDVPAWLIPSSTPGHSHLYFDIRLDSERYWKLLWALAEAGIIEHGYASASIQRGGTHLRLPWVRKARPNVTRGYPLNLGGPTTNH